MQFLVLKDDLGSHLTQPQTAPLSHSHKKQMLILVENALIDSLSYTEAELLSLSDTTHFKCC